MGGPVRPIQSHLDGTASATYLFEGTLPGEIIMKIGSQEIEDVREEWPARLARLLRVRARIDTTGMTRPPRDPIKREFLERTGQLGPFRESGRVPCEGGSGETEWRPSQGDDTGGPVRGLGPHRARRSGELAGHLGTGSRRRIPALRIRGNLSLVD